MVEVIAHRGASAEAPGNSLRAFELAIEMGVDWIEFDVHLSLDGIPVVIHDAELDGRAVSALNAEELHLPTLSQVLALQRRSVGLMVELKVDCVAEVLPLVGGKHRIVVGSLDPAIVAKVPLNLVIGIADSEESLSAYRDARLKRLAVSFELDYAGQWVWTVDGIDGAKEAIAQGASGIITNDPRSLLRHLP